MSELERSMTQAAFDMSYIRGKIEDMPTKDWVNSKLGLQTAILVAIMAVGFTVIGVLVAK
ncbi:hypothetical protein ACN9JG_06140 [Cereibacter azotoformans]|uniref:hypothetical protein n=1 Tax=Cereibacter azotoformans TaxID=43057 RepID=UPI003B20CF35